MGAFLAISSTAFSSGISYGFTVILAYALGLLVVAYFAPRIKKFGDKYKAHTIGDWIGFRYSKQTKFVVSLTILISYLFWTALEFVAIAGLITVMVGLDFEIALILASLVCIVYTTAGGIKSDFYTDAIQFFIITIALFLILLPLGLIRAGPEFFSALPAGFLNPFSFGGISFFIAGLIFGAPTYLVATEMWQRVYASTTPKESKTVFIFSAILLVIFLVPAMILGMIAFHIVPQANSNFAIFELMKEMLPVGILGLGIAGILAATMSTIDSMILVGSATLLKDFHKTFFNKKLNDSQMLKYGRIYTFGYGFLGLIIAYLIPKIVQLQIISSATLAVLAPAVIGGFVWKKASSQASFWSILLGIIVTFALYPLMPTLSFIPGTLTSIILFVIISKMSYKKSKHKSRSR